MTSTPCTSDEIARLRAHLEDEAPMGISNAAAGRLLANVAEAERLLLAMVTPLNRRGEKMTVGEAIERTARHDAALVDARVYLVARGLLKDGD
jgi:hypothetical protein